MKRMNKTFLLLAFICIGLYAQAIYANDTVVSGSNMKLVEETNGDKKTVNLTSEDSYIRITLDANKYYPTTFETQLNLEGGAKEGTNIVIKVNSISTDKEDTVLILDTKEYKVVPIGSTKSFNQLIELFDGKNEINLTYTHVKDKKINGTMTFVIEKFTEKDKSKMLELSKPEINALTPLK
ncbi:hypothetical protein CS063_12005 [Sporanaerobium hydrogeniformans]|uniref:Uncharacterized protein n=1 Tax=Sporanaerobium hydrogeniformans TaxID=3072179 RepID=A0AC61DBM7_9FIRM|nr:hypothetical protein [Sporanaerobium hydrogeniformans]PHV70195.1 hypothetical protein CS063_12005 [Sporanaerobium hydrogeniformans]